MNISLSTLSELQAGRSYYLSNTTGTIKRTTLWQWFKCATGFGDGREKVRRLAVAVRDALLDSAGIEGELRHHVRSRARVGHDKKYYINRNSLDVNDFGYNALFGIGTNQFTVFARYNISDFFGSKSRVDAQPFFIGINFSDF